MTDQLPPDLLAFLDSGEGFTYRPNQCECGAVTLYPAREVKLIELRVNSYGSDWVAADPHKDDIGSYIVPAYDLVASCEGYLPRGILVYVPALECYATHDDDHGDLRVFPAETTWAEIADHPTLYLNENWYPGSGEVLNPLGSFAFRPGG